MEFPKDIPQLIFALILTGIGVLFVLYNLMIFYETVVRQREASSVIPIFGGIFACAGIMILPVEGTVYYSWIPIVLDWGGLPLFMTAFVKKTFRRKENGGKKQER